MHLVYRKTCRICGSAALTEVITLGPQYLQGSFIKPGKPLPPMRRIDTGLHRCDPTRDEHACGLLQTSVTVPPEILYASYWYRSGTNQTMRDHLRGITEEAMKLVAKDNAVVLDIGCNDGTLLKSYPKSVRKFGVDPSDVAREITDDEIEVVQDFFPSMAIRELVGPDGFDIITSIAMFYDLEDPVAFVGNIRDYLKLDGLWIFEMSYMPTMLQMNSYDTICHEHLEYYSLSVLENLLRRSDMKIVRVGFNDINGGSIRCYATHTGNYRYTNPEYQNSLTEVRSSEFELELDTDKPYRNFQERIDKHGAELNALLKSLKREGKTIHVYGASTKGNTILQWCGIDNTVIDFAADRNPDKDGARTIGSDIPIISEEKSRAMKPDYYLVLPWHFKDEFIKREEAALSSGTKFIFPSPEIEIFEGKAKK